MCFRPPTATKAINCPNCGAPNPAGFVTKCIKCKADLTEGSDKK